MLNATLANVDAAIFAAVTRRRFSYFGRFVDSQGVSMMAMTPTHKVRNAILFPSYLAKKHEFARGPIVRWTEFRVSPESYAWFQSALGFAFQQKAYGYYVKTLDQLFDRPAVTYTKEK